MKKNSASDKRPVLPVLSNLRIDQVVEILLLLSMIIVPIIFDRRLGIVFSGTKVTWLRVIVILAASLWAVKLLIFKEHRFWRSALDWPVVSFLFTTTIASLTSIHVYTSVAGFYGRFEGLTTWYLYGLLFFIATNYLQNCEQIKRLIVTVICSATIMSIYSIIQRQELDPYMWGGVVTWQRVIGTIGQPNFIAAYVLMAFFLALYLLLEDKKWSGEVDWAQQLLTAGSFVVAQVTFLIMIYTLEAGDVFTWYLGFALIAGCTLFFSFNFYKLWPPLADLLVGLAILLAYICLLYTQSRGGYMGFFTGAVLFAFIAGRRWIFRHWQKLVLIAGLIILISGVTMLSPEYSPFERFTGEISSAPQSSGESSGSALELKGAAGSRGETWKSGFKIIADNPLFGVGPEVLKFVFPRYETDLFRFKETFHVKQDRNHNEIFDVSVTKGLISFMIYLWIIIILFRLGLSHAATASDSKRLLLAGLLAAALSYLVQNQFSFGVVAITSLFWVIWAAVMVVVRSDEAEPDQASYKLKLEQIPWLPVSGIGLIALLLIWLSFFSFFADIHFKSGKTNLEMRRLPEAVAELQRSLAIFPFEGVTISHLGIANLNLGDVEGAKKYLLYGTEVDPYNADNYYMLSRLYLSLTDRGQKDALTAVAHYTEIVLQIDPYYAEAYETKGLLAERAGQLEPALNWYEKAFSVNPTLTGPMNKVSQLANQTGRTAEAKKLLDWAQQRFPDNTDLFKAREMLR